MQIDLESLRRHYASLSDDDLLEVDRAELVEAAQACYDEELGKRAINDEPDWLEEANCACTFSRQREDQAPPEAENAFSVLHAAGIPCELVMEKIEDKIEAPRGPQQPWFEYRLMVPANLNMHAASVLDKEIFNLEIEAGWRTYFESLSDEELQALDTEELFAGLRDRLERALGAYQDAVKARGGTAR